MTNRVNYATVIEKTGLDARDYPHEKFVKNHPVWVVLPKVEAIVYGHEGWEITKISKNSYTVEIIKKFG